MTGLVWFLNTGVETGKFLFAPIFKKEVLYGKGS